MKEEKKPQESLYSGIEYSKLRARLASFAAEHNIDLEDIKLVIQYPPMWQHDGAEIVMTVK